MEYDSMHHLIICWKMIVFLQNFTLEVRNGVIFFYFFLQLMIKEHKVCLLTPINAHTGALHLDSSLILS